MKFILAGLLCAVALLATQGLSYAFENPHKAASYPLDTDACAQCHRSHTSVSEHLNIPFAQNEQCYACHDGTGSIYNIEAAFAKRSHHSLGGPDVGSTKQCSSCHEVHVAGPDSGKLLVDPRNARTLWSIVDTTSPSYDNTTTPSGLYRWCESCHTDSQATPPWTVMLTAENTDTVYIPYDVQVIWRTSYAQVDYNGDTDTAGYWQFFTSETVFYTGDTTETRFGYNDPLAVGQSAHGRASSSPEARAAITTWRGGYAPDYAALPCTACHAQHGSDQPWMIVDTVTIDGTDTAGYDMGVAAGQRQFCESCHVGTYNNCDVTQKCTNCHRHGKQF